MAAQEILDILKSTNISNILNSKDANTIDVVLKTILLISQKENFKDLYDEAILKDLIEFAEKSNNSNGQTVLDCFINIAVSQLGANFIGRENFDFLIRIMNFMFDKQSVLADRACKILTNVSRYEEFAVTIGHHLIETNKINDMIEIINNKSYNSKGEKMEYMAQVVGNICQSLEVRDLLVENGHLEKILPVLHQGKTIVERFGIASIIYNILFDRKYHQKCIDPPLEILPVILLPLAGPEEFDDETNDKLPLDLQYLPEDKQREEDADIRKILLRSLLLLCDQKSVRTFVRDNNAYYILREYHKWEQDKSNLLAAENVIDILIRTEEEIGLENLSSVDVPEDVKAKFEKWDNDYVED